MSNIRLTDALATACATQGNTIVNLSGKTFTNGNNVAVSIVFGGNGNFDNAILEPGEYFSYSCARPNTPSAFINTAGVTGESVNTGTPVSDEDTSEVLVEDPIFDLALRKVLATNPINLTRGGVATFLIEVTNQGTIDATNVEVTDYIPAGLTLNDAAWTQSGQNATRVIGTVPVGRTVTRTITFTINADAPNNISNFAEISEDNAPEGNEDCDSTPDGINGNQPGETDGALVDDEIGDGCNPGGDEDDSDIETITLPGGEVFDLALQKTFSQGTLNPGGSVTFNVRVFNQGTVDATNVEVTDYIPAGLTLNDTAWTQSGQNATRVISSVAAGQTETIQITFDIADGFSGEIRNFAEISEDNAPEGNEDCDSIPDGINGNQSGETDGALVDDEIGDGCNPGGDEDDSDVAVIEVEDPVFDLALRKVLITNPNNILVGGEVVFAIEVINQGTINATNVEVTDYIPAGLTLNDAAWTQSGQTATRIISSIPA